MATTLRIICIPVGFSPSQLCSEFGRLNRSVNVIVRNLSFIDSCTNKTICRRVNNFCASFGFIFVGGIYLDVPRFLD